MLIFADQAIGTGNVSYIYIGPNAKDKTKQYINKLYIYIYMYSKNVCKLMVWYSQMLACID